jgi:RNA polymerase sigma factor (sigma-70 family)
VPQILSTARSGSNITEQICIQYTPLVHGIVRRCQIPTSLRDDARQEGFTGLLAAVSRYDATSPVHFAVFARPYVKGAVLRRIYTQTQVAEVAAADPHEGQPSSGDTYEVEDRVLSAVQVEAWMATLSLADAWLLRRLYWEDAATDEIAVEMGLTRRRVNQIHTKLLHQGATVLGGDG